MGKAEEEASLGEETKTQQQQNTALPRNSSCSRLFLTLGSQMSAPTSPPQRLHTAPTPPLHHITLSLIRTWRLLLRTYYVQLFDHLTEALPPSSLNCKLSSHGSSSHTLAWNGTWQTAGTSISVELIQETNIFILQKTKNRAEVTERYICSVNLYNIK